MTHIKHIITAAALAVASFAAAASGDYHAQAPASAGNVSGTASASAATAPGQMGASYSFASGAGQAKFGGQAFDASTSGVAWNQSAGGATGVAASRVTPRPASPLARRGSAAVAKARPATTCRPVPTKA